MERFFLNLYNSTGYVPDLEGLVAESLGEVRQLAIDNIRSILSEAVREGELDLCGRIEVTDKAGACVMVIPFRDALQVVGAESTR